MATMVGTSPAINPGTYADDASIILPRP
jgi:hypothetical protein